MWWGLLGKFHPIEVWILPKNWICKNDVFSSPSFHNKSILHIHWMTAVDNTVYKTAWPFPNHCTHTWNRHKNTTLDRITGLLLSSHQHTMTQPASKNRLLTKIAMINSSSFFLNYSFHKNLRFLFFTLNTFSEWNQIYVVVMGVFTYTVTLGVRPLFKWFQRSTTVCVRYMKLLSLLLIWHR